MKHTVKAVLIVASLMSLDASASSYPARLSGKIANGIANAATGIAEVPKG